MDTTVNEKLEALKQELENSIGEGRMLRVGTIRMWKSGKYQKTSTGWVPVHASMKSIAARAAHTSAPQDLKHASPSSGKTPSYPGESRGGRTSAQATPTAKISKGSTPSYTHQVKGKGKAYATPTPSQSAPASSKPGGVMSGRAEHVGLEGFKRLAGLSTDRLLEMKRVADMDDDEVVGAATSLAAQATFARRGKRPMQAAEAKRFKECMQRIKDEGLMDDNEADKLSKKWKGESSF